MRVVLFFWMLACWIGVGGWTCSGMMEVHFVTPERAEEMGIEVTAQPGGPESVWVKLRFKREGALEHYGPERHSRVELRISEGETPVVIAGLKERQAKDGEVQVSLMVGRAALDSTSLMVVVGSGLIPGGGYEVKLKDFIDPEALDAAEAARRAAAAAGAAPAATPADGE